jgi:alpha-tubulin suppressor-like RCC1 family protein
MSTTTFNTGNRTFQATAVAIPAYSLVTVDSSGTISVSGDNATEQCIGAVTEDVAASAYGSVQMLNTGGTIQLIAGGDTIAVAATVYLDGSGKVGTDTSNTKIGLALKASSTDGDVIEVIPHQTFLA